MAGRTSRAVPKIACERSRLARVAVPSQSGEPTPVLNDYLTWYELIHTSYFRVPRFCKLVCYAIAHSPGFRPSEEFKRDPNYELMGQWLEEIKPKAEQPLSSA